MDYCSSPVYITNALAKHNMGEPAIRKIVCMSWIRKQAADEFEALRQDPRLDPEFFTDEELEHYIKVKIMSHADEWMVINDIANERVM